MPKWKLRYSYPFCHASVPNEGLLSNCGRVVAQFSNSALSNYDVTGRIFTKFPHFYGNASLFRRFVDTNVYETDSVKMWNTRHEIAVDIG